MCLSPNNVSKFNKYLQLLDNKLSTCHRKALAILFEKERKGLIIFAGTGAPHLCLEPD